MNIFENAKFGDKFRSRDGELNIYVRCFNGELGYHYLLRSDHVAPLPFNDEGSVRFFNKSLDIVGKWEEPIDEDELDRMANKLYPDFQFRGCSVSNNSERKAFKAGYRKALEK